MQSTFSSDFHVAIIMDGNGRWATERGWPRTRGHQAGADAVERTVESAATLGITDLTLYAFSSDNWKRPQAEVDTLMQLFHRYLLGESARCRRNGIALRVIGRRDRLPADLVGAIASAERRTRAGSRMTLRLAVDYSSRWSLANACGSDDVRSAIAHANHDGSPMPDVDVLIRTGREKRLSDFLLWECSYAELFFLDTLWPDFTGDELARCVEEFRSRSRRFGAVEAQEASHGVR